MLLSSKLHNSTVFFFYIHSCLWCVLLDNLPDYAGLHQKPGVTLRTGECCRQPSNVVYVHKSEVYTCACRMVFGPPSNAVKCVLSLARPPQPGAEFQTGEQKGRLSRGGVGVLLGPWHRSRNPEKDKIQGGTEGNRQSVYVCVGLHVE